MADASSPLWKCPRCGAKLVSRNLSHACGDFSVERFLAGKGVRARTLFERFARLIGESGPYELAPAKTRVAFMVEVRFASVNHVSEERIDVHFVLPQKLASPRFRKIERIGNVYVHHLRMTSAAEMDGELRGWLKLAYVEYGQRAWLLTSRVRGHRPPPSSPGRSLTGRRRRRADRR